MNAINHTIHFQRAAKFIAALFVSATLLVGAPLFAASTRYISAAGADGSTCSSAAAPCKTFAYAINQAVSGDTINVAQGDYKEHDIQLNKSLTLVGAGKGNNGTRIDAQWLGRIFFVPVGVTVSISDMTLLGGKVSGTVGGGILNTGNLTLTKVVLNNNQTDQSGAGIFNEGTLTLNSSFVYNNFADISGGGVYNVFGSATVTMTDTMVSGNSAQYGGGILNYNGATATLTNSRLSHNTALAGGGGFDNNNATVTFNNVTVDGNSAKSTGGGLENDNNGTSTLTNVTFSANSVVNGNGGGMFNYNGATAVLANATFSDNSAIDGGGIFNESATATFTNTTFTGNSALAGGAILNDNNAIATFTNVTFSGNYGSWGGAAIENDVSTVYMKNTIIANSIGNANCEGGVPINSLGHNLSSDGTCNLLPASGDLVNVDPQLLTLSNNGKNGLTQTLALAKGSPAIDAGTNSGCTSKDQRGMKRPIDGDANGSAVCDIGSYEYKKH